MQRDSVANTFLVATLLCLVCSVLVSAAAVGLRPYQKANRERERYKNILLAAGLYEDGTPIEETFKKRIETRIVDLATGGYVPADEIDPKDYDPAAAARDPELSVAIPSDEDIAGIKRREKYAPVYLVQGGGRLEKIVLPVYGKGLWSTLYGFISLDADLRTIRGLTFYAHGETPGLGGEIDNPQWKAYWEGKKAFDDQGELVIHVIKGSVDAKNPRAEYQVDGLSGATITSNGVTNLVQYWLGPHGFGEYLEQLKNESDSPPEGGRDG